MTNFKLLWFAFALGFLISSCGSKNGVVIEGEIANSKGLSLKLENFNAGRVKKIEETVLTEKGKFKFKFENPDTTDIIHLTLNDDKKIQLIVSPKEKITIKATAENFSEDYTVSGSEQSEEIKKLQTQLFATRKKVAEIEEKYSNASSQEKEALEQEYLQVLDAQHKFSTEIIRNKPSTLVAYFALYQHINPQTPALHKENDIKFYRIVAQAFKNDKVNSKYFDALVAELERYKKRQASVKINQIIEQAENSYPALSLKNNLGDTISLKEMEAKYVLLQFGILDEGVKQQLLPIYQKYKQKGLEIYFVDLNREEKVWQDTADELDLPWTNVHDNTGYSLGVYNVQKVPANYLIETKGSIIGKNLFGRYLEERLSQL